jgi:hypothetical protein
MSSGWIKLHRKIIDNPIFKNDKLFRVFMYLLLKASHSDRDQLVGDCIVKIKKGQLASGRKAISKGTGLTEQNVRTAISKLKALGILTTKPHAKYSVISISNWDSHQQDNQQVTSNQPASNQQVTTNKKGKNDKKDNIHQLIVDQWNEIFTELPQVIKISQQRKSHITSCMNEFKKEFNSDTVDGWMKIFKYASGSDFLMGRKIDWSMDFDFIINKGNLLKIIEGKYDNQ